MIDSLILDTGWTLSALDPDLSSPAYSLPAVIPATVPGTVHTDLLAAGLIDDPYLDLNELADPWIGHTVWVYRTLIEGGSGDALDASDGQRRELVFDGLDTVATVMLDGQVLGTTANQHRSHRFDVTELLHSGPNVLEVRFDSAWAYAEARQAELGELPNAYPTPFNFIRKMAANFGWDWGPQLVTAGIWRQVRLESWSTARLGEVRQTVTVKGGPGEVAGAVTVGTVVRRPPEGAGEVCGPLTLVVEIAGQRSQSTFVGSETTAEATVTVPSPELWWPVGMGPQPLYQLRVSLRDADGVLLDVWERRIGFRTVELDTSADETGSAFTITVNGVPVFVRGANWIPDDCFPSRLTRERYEARVDQAVDANFNLLRVWGGGIYESDELYNACDERGVLVWQDFLFACAAYPEEEPFASEVEAEARENVLRLAPHASLVLWNGCNENIWGWFDWDWQQAIVDRTWGLGFYTELLPAVVAELDPTTPYWPGSPFSGSMEWNANDVSRGNVHIWDVWNKVDYTAYGDYEPRFVSEFGFQGPPTWSTLTASIHDKPITPTSPGMLLHQKADDGNGKLERGMAPHLPEPRSFEDWHYLTQLNQSRAIEFAITRYRSQRPHCMGTIVWQLNDCWPVTSWAAVDGYGRRKPLWHGLRRANAERIVTLQPTAGGLVLVVVNDGVSDWEDTITVARRSFDGTELALAMVALSVPRLSSMTVDLGGEYGTELVEPGRPEGEYLVATAASDGARSLHLYREDKDLALETPGLHVEVSAWHGGEALVEISSASLARGVVLFVDRLDPEAWADDAGFDVEPGAPVRIVVHSPAPLDPARLAAHPVLRSVNDIVAAEADDARSGPADVNGSSARLQASRPEG